MIPLYGGRVVAYNKRSAYIETIKACGAPEGDDMETCRGMCFPAQNEAGGKLYALGWFDGDCQTLVHECGHVAMFVVMHAGINPTDSSGEAYCYVLDHVFGQIVDKRRRCL